MSELHLVSSHPATYADLESIPDRFLCELVNGRLHVMSRPRARNLHMAGILNSQIGRPFGGWWILLRPEAHFVLDTQVTVPDLAGWRRERMPELPDDQRFTIIPDWLCEILSPTTRRHDLEDKVPLYARYGVPFLWLIDVDAPWLSAQVLENGRYQEFARFGPDETVRARPFEAVELEIF